MTLTFTPEHEELRANVRAFLERKSPEAEVRRLMETEAGYDADVWQQLSRQLGLPALVIPEEFGGGGGSFLELGIVLEEMGRALFCAPYFSTAVLAASALMHIDDDAAKKEYLPALASGDSIGTLALAEDAGTWTTDGVRMQARCGEGGTWLLSGTKNYVTDGHTADLLLVAARTESGGVSLFAVSGNAAGLTKAPLTTMDQTRKQARLDFEEVPARLVGSEGAAEGVLAHTLDLAAVGLAAEQVGGASQALADSVDYAKKRFQFGRPIGSFQAVKHKCAAVLVDVEAARSVAYHAMTLAARPGAELTRAASLAKSHCSEAYLHASAENIQIHGGIGFTWEHSAHLHFKRAKSSELMFGGPLQHRRVLADLIGL